jgi:hypothetical protein
VSLAGALAKLTGGGLSLVAPTAVVALSVPSIVLAWRIWTDRLGRSVVSDLAVVAPLVVLLSPQAWDYTVLTTLPAVLVATTVMRSTHAVLRVVAVGFACVAACDFIVLLGRGATYVAVMRWSPNTWFLIGLFTLTSWHRSSRVSRFRL